MNNFPEKTSRKMDCEGSQAKTSSLIFHRHMAITRVSVHKKTFHLWDVFLLNVFMNRKNSSWLGKMNELEAAKAEAVAHGPHQRLPPTDSQCRTFTRDAPSRCVARSLWRIQVLVNCQVDNAFWDFQLISVGFLKLQGLANPVV